MGGGGWGRFPNFCTQAQTLIKKYTLDTIQKYNSKPESNLKLLPFLSQTGQCHLKCTPYSHLAGLSITLYHSVFFNRDIYVSFAFEFQKLYLHFVFGNAILSQSVYTSHSDFDFSFLFPPWFCALLASLLINTRHAVFLKSWFQFDLLFACCVHDNMYLHFLSVVELHSTLHLSQTFRGGLVVGPFKMHPHTVPHKAQTDHTVKHTQEHTKWH